MAISIRYGLKQTQRLSLSQTQIQGLELLQLSNMELYERIMQEMQDNPVLEEELQAHESASPADSSQPAEEDKIVNMETEDIPPAEIATGSDDEPLMSNASENPSDHGKNYLELAVADKETLKEHLLSQARLSDKRGAELSLLEALITSLDDRGFLTRKISEYAAELEVAVEKVRDALSVIQLYDPVGCAVGCVEESIEVQALYLYPNDTLLHRIIKEHFLDLERLDHGKIAQALHVPVQKVMEKNSLIHDLDPYPGRRFSPGAVNYVLPDLEVRLIAGEIVIILNDEWIPRILINPYYLSFLGKKNIEKNLKEYIQGKVKSARNLVRNISGRRATIFRVTNSIMAHQRDFLEKGPGHLKPLTLGDVAREVNLHESTVSRVTSSKYVQTSWGIFDLKYFFVTKLKSSGEDASADRAMKRVAEIIGNESADSPHSDEKVAALLASEGINLARRTVAKYRELLGIPSSGRRSKINRLKTEGNL